MRARVVILAAAILAPLSSAWPAEPLGDGYSAYYGVTHTHTGMTDGEPGSTPATAYGYARSRGLDWLMVNEHNHTCAGLASGEYGQGQQQAFAATQDGQFVALFGMEWGVSSGGHVTVFEAPLTIGWSASNCGGNFYEVPVDSTNYSGAGGLYEAMWRHPTAWGPVLGTFAHPHDGEFNNYSMGSFGKDVIRYVELIKGNGGWRQQDESARGSILESRYQWLLSRGWNVGAVQSHDAHGHNWGSATADRTGIVALGLTKDDLMRALYARRTFVSQDKNAWVRFKADAHWMGEEFAPSAPVLMSVSTGDGDGEPFVRITLVAGRVVADEPVSLVADEAGSTLSRAIDPPASDTYYYVVAYQADGDRVYSSPIWLRADATAPTPTPAPAATSTPAPASTPTRTPTAAPATATRTPTAPPAPAGAVVINEYLPSPSGIDWDGNGSASYMDEWIEIYNGTAAPVELSTLRLGDLARTYSLPSGTLGAGCLKVYFRAQTGIGLNSGADTVFLKNSSGAILDQHSYSSDAANQSKGRSTDGGPAWTTFSSPTLGTSNDGIARCSAGGPTATPVPPTATRTPTPVPPTATHTPTPVPPTATRTPTPVPPTATRTPTPVPPTATHTPTAPPAPAGAVVINEYLPSPSGIDWDGNGSASYMDEWIEIYNGTTSPVELSTLRLGDPNRTYTLPSGTLKPGCLKVYFRSQTGIALNTGSDTVYLKTSSGTILDTHRYSSDASNRSNGRVSDGGSAWTTFSSPTLAASNDGVNRCVP